MIAGITMSDRSEANAFRLPNQDPEAIARGNAFTATADDPAAIYYNPAGITQLSGENVQAGLYLISVGEDYKSPSGATAKAASGFQPVPQIYYARSFTNVPVAIGLGIYAPYGLAINYGNNSPLSTAVQSANLLYVSVNPVIAWRVCKTLSVGIGPTFNISQASFKRAIGITPGDQFSMEGSGTDLGFNAGILWQPLPKWSFGVNYRSRSEIDYEGTSHASPYYSTVSSSASIKFPLNAVGGISFRPTTNWNVEADVDWTDWSSVKQIVFRNTSFGDVPLTLDYRSGCIYEAGVTRELGAGYFASVGYMFSQNSSPNANFTPLIPDSNLQLGGIGFGHHGRHWDWMISYQFAYNGGRTVTGDATPAVDGTYKTFNNAVNLGATFKF
jgi:long-chain fatty acid transport protein